MQREFGQDNIGQKRNKERRWFQRVFFIFLHFSILMEKSYCGEVGGKINEIRDNNKLAEKSIIPKNRISYDC